MNPPINRTMPSTIQRSHQLEPAAPSMALQADPFTAPSTIFASNFHKSLPASFARLTNNASYSSSMYHLFNSHPYRAPYWRFSRSSSQLRLQYLKYASPKPRSATATETAAMPASAICPYSSSGPLGIGSGSKTGSRNFSKALLPPSQAGNPT